MLPFIQGVGAGLFLLFSLGPAFFTILKTSITSGFGKTVPLVFGIFVSDVIYAYLVLAGLSHLINNDEEVRQALAFSGAIILLTYAMYTLYAAGRDKAPENNKNKDTKLLKSPWLLFLKGLLINGVNPFMVIFWIGITSVTTVNLNYDFNEQLTFFAGILITMFCLDLSKAYFSNRIRHLITPKVMFKFNIVMGLILLGFSIRLFYVFFSQTS